MNDPIPSQITREHYEADVNRPGKFEGEAPWVPYFWDRLDEATEDDGTVVGWEVSAEDLAIWPELENVETVWLMETDSGFVVEVDGPAPEGKEGDYCPNCGEETDTDCWGSPQCPICDPPCPGCSDQ
jgi:hypothetical protein